MITLIIHSKMITWVAQRLHAVVVIESYSSHWRSFLCVLEFYLPSAEAIITFSLHRNSGVLVINGR